MISDSGIKINEAKERMWAALYGLLLLTACWLILYTINPNLLRFDLFTTDVPASPNSGAAPLGAPTSPNLVGPTSNAPLITNDPLTPDQNKALNTALQEGQTFSGATTIAVGAMPTTDPNDPLINQFAQQCSSYNDGTKAGVATAAVVATYFTKSPIVATAGAIAAGSLPIYSVQTIPGDKVGLPGATVQTCVTDIYNN